MSDILNIRVTEAELDLIMELLHEAGFDRVDDNGQPAIELCHDLMEQSGVSVDELDATDLDDGLTGQTFTVAEEDFIDHGMRARELRKAEKMARGVSMAATRRSEALGRSAPKMTATQRHDVFESGADEREATQEASRKLCGNDPIDW
jgi:hypothetical protein